MHSPGCSYASFIFPAPANGLTATPATDRAGSNARNVWEKVSRDASPVEAKAMRNAALVMAEAGNIATGVQETVNSTAENARPPENSAVENPAPRAMEPDPNDVKSASATEVKHAVAVRVQAKNPAMIVKPGASVPATCATEKGASDAIAVMETDSISKGNPSDKPNIQKQRSRGMILRLRYFPPSRSRFCGEYRSRTGDLLHAMQAL